jgi:hypothetical protein
MNRIETRGHWEAVAVARSESARHDPDRRARMIAMWKAWHAPGATKRTPARRGALPLGELPLGELPAPLELTSPLLPPPAPEPVRAHA